MAVAAYDTIKDGFCKIDDVDCSKIAVAGFSGGAGIASMLSTLPILSFGTIPALPITAQLTLAWAPLFGAGALGVDLPQYYHPVFVNGAPLGPPPPGPPFGMFMDVILPPEKRFSVISEQDELFGNPTTASPIAIFPLQQVFSDYCKLEITTGDCIQSSGAGYYVVPAGEITTLPGQSYHVAISANPTEGFFAPGGQVWQAEAAFEWLLGAAFGP